MRRSSKVKINNLSVMLMLRSTPAVTRAASIHCKELRLLVARQLPGAATACIRRFQCEAAEKRVLVPFAARVVASRRGRHVAVAVATLIDATGKRGCKPCGAPRWRAPRFVSVGQHSALRSACDVTLQRCHVGPPHHHDAFDQLATVMARTTAIGDTVFLRNVTARRSAGFARPSPSEITRALSTLGVTISISEKDLKKKYIDLVRLHHPDRGGDEEKMKDLTTSYDLIGGLSESEKQSYQQQLRSGYGPSSGRGGGGNGNQPFHEQRAYDFAAAYQRHAQQQGQQRSRPLHYRYTPEESEKRHQGMENLFRNSGPMSGVLSRLQRTPLYIVLMRALVAYLVFSSLLLLMYRSYMDRASAEGWNSLHSTARYERMEDLFRTRQEQLERLREGGDRRSILGRKDDVERNKERRAMEYAEQRVQDLRKLETQSWPTLPADGALGCLLKDPKDPLGITYFEPQLPASLAASTSASQPPAGTAATPAGTSPPTPPTVVPSNGSVVGGGSVLPAAALTSVKSAHDIMRASMSMGKGLG